MSDQSEGGTKARRDGKMAEIERKTNERTLSIGNFFSTLIRRKARPKGSLPPHPGGLRIDNGGDWVIGEEIEPVGGGPADFKLRIVTGSIAVIIAESLKYSYMRIDDNGEPVFHHFNLDERHKRPEGTGWKKSISARSIMLSPHTRMAHILSSEEEASEWHEIVTKLDNRVDSRVKEGKAALSPMIHLIPGGISLLGFAEIPPEPSIPRFDPNFKIKTPIPMIP